MLDYLEIIGIALAISIDAMVVSLCWGIGNKNIEIDTSFKVAFSFGFFQGFMPFLGFTLGKYISSFIFGLDHWIAFFLLTLVSVDMFRNSFSSHITETKYHTITFKNLLFLSIATSLDALAIGFSFYVSNKPIVFAIFVFAVVCFVGCFLALMFAKYIKSTFTFTEKMFLMIGSTVLFIIALQILYQHGVFDSFL